MVAFDAAERNVCTVRRQTTSTPLQALALLNDPQVVEAARNLAARSIKEKGAGPDDRGRVAWMFRLVTGRRASPGEVAVLGRLLAEQRDAFRGDPAAAKALLAVGESPADPALDPAELAAATVLAEAIFNHDEAVMRR
jgi:hypothetical protein